MKQRDSFDFDDAFVSYDDVEQIVRRARADRDAALRCIMGSALQAAMTPFRRLGIAIDDARRLKALATSSDPQLEERGIDRSDLPAIVYGWTSCRTVPVAEIVPIREAKTSSMPGVRVAA